MDILNAFVFTMIAVYTVAQISTFLIIRRALNEIKKFDNRWDRWDVEEKNTKKILKG